MIVVKIFNSAKEEDLISVIEGTSIFHFWEQKIGHSCIIQKTEHYSILKTRIASHALNGAYDCHFEIRDHNYSVEILLHEIIAHFGERNLPYSLIIPQHQVKSLNLEPLLLKNNFKLVSKEFGMALELRSLIPPLSVPKNLAISEVATEAEFQDFIEVTIHGFGLPSPEAHDLFGRFSLGQREPKTTFFVGYCDEKPVTAALVANIKGVANLHNVVTPPKYRKKGFGSAITYAALRNAKNTHHLRYGTLQSSEMGNLMYQKLGFKCYTIISTFHCQD